jgi:hypothetical protein
MSSIFIRVYLDEDVNVLVADLLNVRGFDALDEDVNVLVADLLNVRGFDALFDALTVRDAGQLRASDAEQLTQLSSKGL